jgi:fluoroacetyl-CoA thioesterase
VSAPRPAGTGPGLAPGLRASVQVTVTEADTAVAMGSGDVPVLGTPRLLAVAEAAAAAAVTPHIEPGFTSVGTAVNLEHRRASPPGTQILVEAELTSVDRTRLEFGFIARVAGAGDDNEDAVVGAGTHERVVVDRSRFLARAGRHL